MRDGVAASWVVSAAVAMAAVEALSAFSIDVPAAAIAFALLFLLCAWWLRRRPGVWPVAALAVLFLIEVVFVPTYDRATAFDWIVQMAAVVVGLVGLAACAAWVVLRPRARGERTEPN